MKKLTTFVVGLLTASISFGAVLTNEKYVTNTVNNTIVRELQSFSTQIIERVITDTSITNAGAVEVSKEYTDTKGEEVKSYVDALIASVPKFKIVVVDELPAAADADASTVYLVRNSETEGSQLYSEWIKVVKDDVASMEKLGEAAIKLDGYAKETYVTNKVADAVALANEAVLALANQVAADKAGLEAELAATNAVIFGAVSVADAKGAQGIADAAGALAFAQGVSNDVVTLSSTVAGNKTAAENADAALAGQITAVSNLVVSTDSTMKTYVDGQDAAVGTAANSYTDTKVAAGILTATNFTKAAIADFETKANVTAVSNLAASASAAAATADGKAVAAQETAEAAEQAAAIVNGKVASIQAAATSATNKLNGVTGTVVGLVQSATNAVYGSAKDYTDNLNTQTLLAVSSLGEAYDDLKNNKLPEAKIEAKTNAVNECRYSVVQAAGTVETIASETYIVYDLVDRTHLDLTPSSNKIAFRFPAATNDVRHDRACIVLLKTPAGNAPSIVLLKATGDETTQVFKGNSIYIELNQFEADTTHLIYFNELGVNKWWYQTEKLIQEL